MKKRIGLLILIVLFISIACLGLIACGGGGDNDGGGGNGGNRIVNEEFDEYSKIVTDVARNMVGKLGSKVKSDNAGASAAKVTVNMQAAGETTDVNGQLFDILSSGASGTTVEYVKGYYDSVFEQSAFIPVICGDVISTKYNAEKFYGLTIYIPDEKQYLVTYKEGTNIRTVAFTDGGSDKDVFIIINFDYRSETDFSFNAIQFYDDYSSPFYAYGTSDMQLLYIARYDNETVDCEAVCYKDGIARATDKDAVNDACFEVLDDVFAQIDQDEIRGLFARYDYSVSEDDISQCASKYFQCLAQELPAGFTVLDGVITGYRAGTEGAPSVLALPSDASAIFCDFYIPDGVEKLIIPSNITSVKMFESKLNDLEDPNHKPEEKPEDKMVDCPANYFRIRGMNQPLTEIEVAADSALFSTRNYCLFSKDGVMLYMPSDKRITELALDGNLLNETNRDLFYNVELPNLRRVDITVGYIAEGEYQRAIDPWSWLFSEGKTENVFNLENAVIRGGSGIYIPKSIKSIDKLTIYGSETDQGLFKIENYALINSIEARGSVRDLDVYNGVSEDGTQGSSGDIFVSESIERLNVNAARGDTVRVNLPWSQFGFELKRKYSIFNIDEGSYRRLNWDYNADQHLLNEQIVVAFQPMSKESKQAVNDFCEFQLNEPEMQLYDYECISIIGYKGDSSVIRVPETLEGIPVADFCLENFDYGNNGYIYSVVGVRELYLPKTLKTFVARMIDEYEGKVYDKYEFDKIVYDGTMAEFIALFVDEHSAYALLRDLTREIVCTDGELGAANWSKERLDYVAGDCDLTLYFDWNYRDPNTPDEAGIACLAEFTSGGTTYTAHLMNYAEFSFGFVGIKAYGPKGEYITDYKYSFTIRINEIEYESGSRHIVTVSCRYKSGATAEPEEIALTLTGREESNVIIEHLYTDTPESIATEPGCEYWGLGNFKCTLCEERTQKPYVRPLGHDFGTAVTVPANCIEREYQYHICKRCEVREDFGYVGELGDHDFRVYSGNPATCWKEGYEFLQCKYCLTYDERVLPIKEHDYGEDGLCTICHKEHELYRVYQSEDGWEITGFKDGVTVPSALSLPAYLNNLPVTSIDLFRLSAYDSYPDITSIAIPITVKSAMMHDWDRYAPNLRSVSVAEGNASFYSFDGIVYDKNADQILFVPRAITGKIAIKPGITTINGGRLSGRGGITGITIPNSVTTIEGGAFSDCTGLTSIEIPASVTSIGSGAFSGCTGLTEMAIPDSVTFIDGFAFEGCTNLLSMSMPAWVAGFYRAPAVETIVITAGTAITSPAFNGCASLKNITLPDTLTSINDGAFQRCSGLLSISLPAGLTSLDSNFFSGCTSLASISMSAEVAGYYFAPVETVVITGGEKIRDNAFANCTSLRNVTLPDSITTIGGSAFENCSGLREIALPDSVAIIGSCAFSGCDGLLSLTIPNGVTTIGSWAFSGCGFTSLVIPDSVVFIGQNAMAGCMSLENLTIPFIGTTKDTGGYCATVFGGFNNKVPVKSLVITGGERLMNQAFTGMSSLTNIILPETLTTIGSSAFSGCSSLTSIDLPDSVTSVGDWIFSGCSSLTRISMRAEIAGLYEAIALKSLVIKGGNELGEYSFAGAVNLEEVSLPDELEIIRKGVFKNCSKLREITLPPCRLLEAEIFYGCSGLEKVTLGDVHDKLWRTVGLTDYMFYGCSSLKNIEIPYGYVDIGKNTFENCSALVSATLPDSIVFIYSEAFKGCTSLTDISIPDSISNKDLFDGVFSGCSALRSASIGNRIIDLPESFFFGCTSLTDLTFSQNLETIGASAFSGCTSLTNITLPESLHTIGASAFSGSGLTELTLLRFSNIGVGAFSDCTSLSRISIQGRKMYVIEEIEGGSVSVERPATISDNAFGGCTGLTDVSIGNDVAHLGAFVFSGCSALVNVTIPEGLLDIGNNAFQGCVKLISIVIPDSVTDIGAYAFAGCVGLTSLVIPDKVKDIKAYTFSGCAGLTDIPVFNEVTSIGDFAFSECIGLTRVSMPHTVLTVGASAFANCTQLTSMTVSNQVNSIGDSAFSGCDKLSTLYIPADVAGIYEAWNVDTVIINGGQKIKNNAFAGRQNLLSVSILIAAEIGEYAFSRCTSLISVTIGRTVSSIGVAAFYDCGNVQTITYQGTKAEWNAIQKAEHWDNGLGGGMYTISCTDGKLRSW